MRRRFSSSVMTGLCGACIAIALVPLVSLLWMVVSRGATALSWTFFTHLPKPVGETGGGVGNGLVGSAMLLTLASVIGLPIGVGTGLFLANWGNGAFGRGVRFCCEILSGAPSVVVGLAVYALLVRPMHRFSALAGAIALAILMIPTLARATEEVVRMVPRDLYEASLALGVSEWRSGLKVVARTALGGVATACCLALARAAGETAPLLFTAMGNQFWNFRPDQPTASLPVQIFNYAVSPYRDWQRQAWGAALLLLILVSVLNAVARLAARGRFAVGRP